MILNLRITRGSHSDSILKIFLFIYLKTKSYRKLYGDAIAAH